MSIDVRAVVAASRMQGGWPRSDEAPTPITSKKLDTTPKFPDLPSERPRAQGVVKDAPDGWALDLFNSSANLKILTSKVSMHLPALWRSRLFAKLDALYDPEEWVEGDRLIEPSSFWTFLRAVLQYGPGGGPGIGVSPRGNLLAAWTRPEGRLTLEFTPDSQVMWIVVLKTADSREHAAGTTTLDRLQAVLQPYTPPEWFSSSAAEDADGKR